MRDLGPSLDSFSRPSANTLHLAGKSFILVKDRCSFGMAEVPFNTPLSKRQASRYIYGTEKGGQAQFCGGSVWASTSERYMWVDITSGPSIYGPVFEGEGGTSPKSVPKPAHYGLENWSKAFVADLVGMVADAAEHMFAPPMDR